MDVVIIKWVDSTFQHGWKGLNELKEELAEIVSVGILAKKDKVKVIIMQSYDKDNDNFADGLVIPRRCINSIEIIGNTIGG